MNHPIQCTCGILKGTVNQTEGVNRGVCYCADCQAFAHFLGRNNEILDDLGGTNIIQTLPKNINFTEGTENLACMRLTENGLLRWYTTCCNTPIGNTPSSFKTSFVGLVHICLGPAEGALDDSFGPIRMRVHTKYAKGEPKPKSMGLAATVMRFTGMLLRARLDGSYKQTPFFVAESGTPIVCPKVLSRQELEDVMNAV